MNEAELRADAFAMPRTSPSYPRGPYRYRDREYLTVTYRSDAATLRALVPEPLRPAGETVRFQFIRMPDSTGFGAYHGAAQVIPVRLPDGRAGGYVHAMYLDAHAPIAGGRELWGFPQKLARPVLAVERDTLLGRLDFGPVRVAEGAMGFKHRPLPEGEALSLLEEPGVVLKIIPHVDGRPRICELVRVQFEAITVKGAWSAPATLSLAPHALAPVAELPVREVLGASHVIADVTLMPGQVLHDYLEREDGA
jgi:acetoacetate decarboxylase